MAASSNLAAGVFTLLLVISNVCHVESKSYLGMQSNFYQRSCPGAEDAVARVVKNAVDSDPRTGAGILRVFFHDCFVQGCDASVLITSSSGDAEKDAVPNLTLHSFDVIDDAKAAVEDICPETVSCADVLAYAAATSVSVLGGPRVDIQGGRLDGFVSSINEVANNIPSPLDTLSQLQSLFSSKGLSNQDLVLLAGAHTIGKAHCGAFSNRLYPSVDPTLNGGFASSLVGQCPQGGSNSTVVNNDVQTPTSFDNAYHQNVQHGKVLFTSDEQLYTSSSTSDYVDKYASSNWAFLNDFGDSLINMGQIGVKTGSNGNIRSKCSAFN